MVIEKQVGKQLLRFEKYDSIHSFVESFRDKPNGKFMQGQNSSQDTARYMINWYGTESYEQAADYLENGHKESAEKLTLKIGSVKKQYETQGKRIKSEYSVVGHQASVPRYLQGIPQNMIMQKKVPQKQKVIKLVKSIGYNASVSANTIFEQSAKALVIVEKLEAMGYRVELDLVRITEEADRMVGFQITIKKSSERMNVAKLAFPMVHPSMLRRIGFKWIETTDCVDTKGFAAGYGCSVNTVERLKKIFEKEYILPGFIEDPQTLINEWKL